MTYRSVRTTQRVVHSGYFCDLCGKQIKVATWIFERDPRKQKVHFHIDCLIKLGEKHVGQNGRAEEVV